jgi:DNA sulfur modification protein DndE
MAAIIERVRISAAGRQQLITLKRRTSVEHYNVLCRHALCASLTNPSCPPEENIPLGGGLEIDWKTLTGNAEDTYLNLLITRCLIDEGQVSADAVRRTLLRHLHRGLSYLVSRPDTLMTLPS